MENAFTPVTGEIIEALGAIVGRDHVLTDEESLGKYASDETEDFVFPPDVVVLPASTAEVSAIMRLAWDHAIPVTPRAGGTGLSGGALPVHGGIVLSTERLNRILEIDADNLMAVVEPGVITQELQETVEKVGLYYPPDPASRGSCRLGGNLAECAGGPHAVKYGVTKDYVLGIEAVLPDGTVIRHGGKLLKNSTGYNLTQLIVGSEGTLAVITKIFLKLIPLPKHRTLLLVPVPHARGRGPHRARHHERGDHTVGARVHGARRRQDRGKTSRRLGSQQRRRRPADRRARRRRRGGRSRERAEQVCEIALEQGAIDVLIAESSAKQNEIWTMRRATGEAVKSVSVYKEEDTVVPRYNLVPLLIGVKEIAARYGDHDGLLRPRGRRQPPRQHSQDEHDRRGLERESRPGDPRDLRAHRVARRDDLGRARDRVLAENATCPSRSPPRRSR